MSSESLDCPPKEETFTPTPEETQLLRKLRWLQEMEASAPKILVDEEASAVRVQPLEFRLGNATTLGISVLAVTNTMVSLFLMHARGIQHTNLLVGMLWFTGGCASWLTCIFEIFRGDTFAYCVFGSFGGYYFAFAATLTPAFQIAAGYSSPEEFDQALGIFFAAWATLFVIFFVASLRTHLAYVWIFSTVTATAWCLSAAYFQAGAGNAHSSLLLTKIAGGFLFACSMGGWYLLTRQLTQFVGYKTLLPIGVLTPVVPPPKVAKD